MSQIELFYNVLRAFEKKGLFIDTQAVFCSATTKTGHTFTIKWRVLLENEKRKLDMRKMMDRVQVYPYEYVMYKLRFNKENVLFTEKRPFTNTEEVTFSYQDTEKLMNHVIDVVYSFI